MIIPPYTALLLTMSNPMERYKNAKKKKANEERLALWLATQQENYRKKQYEMENEVIRHKWEEFIQQYKEYL